MTDKRYCAETVARLYGGRTHCRLPATVAEGKRHWCWIHAPSKIAERDAEREKRVNRNWDLAYARKMIEGLCNDVADIAVGYRPMMLPVKLRRACARVRAAQLALKRLEEGE